MLSPPANIDPITVIAFVPPFAPCRANGDTLVDQTGHVRCAAPQQPPAAAQRTAADSARRSWQTHRQGHEMLAPNGCPSRVTTWGLQQAQSSYLEGHPSVTTRLPNQSARWIRAKAVRIGDSPWAPLFTTVVESNFFTATVERGKQSEAVGSLEEFWEPFASATSADAAQAVLSSWMKAGQRRRLGPNHVVLEAPGPSVSSIRTVAIYSDGRVMVPAFRLLCWSEQRHKHRLVDDARVPRRSRCTVRFQGLRKSGSNATRMAHSSHR